LKSKSITLIVLISLIAIFALLVAGIGVFWQGEGQHQEFITLRGENVLIQGHGLYRYESVSFAAQNIAQDTVTLLVGLPLLLIATAIFRNGKILGKLLLAGTLAYFLYTYAFFSFGAAYNLDLPR
jgi:hypothetical protein